MNEDAPTGLALWWRAARPKTLPLAVVPVIVGTALAWGDLGVVKWEPMGVALLVAALIQIATNLHNDAADEDSPDRDGPQRVTAQGWVAAETVKRVALGVFAFAGLGGLYLVWVGGWPILVIGVASLAAGWAYSGGIRPLSHTALGELFVFLFFGLAAVAGSDFLQRQAFSMEALLAGAALGCFAAAVLMVNNYRDLEDDEDAGRRTLAIVVGRRASKVVYSVLMLVPFALVEPLVRLGAGEGAWIALLVLPLALLQMRHFQLTEPGPAFNAILAGTVKTHALFGAVLAFGAVKWPG